MPVELARIVVLVAAAICVGAYVVGYIVRPAAMRALSVTALFATIVGLAQLYLALQTTIPQITNVVYAAIFFAGAGVCQAVTALRRRKDRAEEAALTF